MADTELSNKLNAGYRYATTVGSTLLTVGAALTILTPEQVADLKANVEILKDSVLTGYGALMKMWIILGPIAIGFAIKMGWSSSSVQAMAGKLLKIAGNKADPAATEAKVAIVNAAASPTIGSQGVINKEMASNPATSDNVVATASQIPPKAA